MSLKKSNTYTTCFDWWEELDYSWKSIFCYDYLLKYQPEKTGGIVWNNKEIGGYNNGVFEGTVNICSVIKTFPHSLWLVMLRGLTSESIFDFSSDFNWDFEYEGANYKISWNICPTSSTGLRELNKLKVVHFYKQNNDPLQQPIIDVTDFMNLHSLEELHLHISHCYQLEDILLLNLPKLKKINFYNGINNHSYWRLAKEESIINSIKSKTRVELQLNCYPDF